MKTSIYKILRPAGIMAAFFLLSATGFSQTRKLPDGTIIYGDGTKRLPNGTVVYQRRTIGQKGTTVRLPDGSVIWPDGNRRYPNDDRRKRHGRWLPPGQAKKIYGGRARDYAPGQQRRWKERDDEHEHEGHHGNRGRGREEDD